MRTRPEGLTDERQELQMFGVSAVDGQSAWINLPGVDVEDQALIGWFALSPDGRWIGWSRQRPPRRLDGNVPLLGWTVMDTTTGKVRRFADPSATHLRETSADLVFSSDSQYLLTSYEKPDAPAKRGHQFVAWNLEDGTSTVLEEPGHYWLPDVGSAPRGVVWSRRRTVHREAPASGVESSYFLPQWVVAASWAPDDISFAYLGRRIDRARAPWHLYGGRSLEEARDRALPLDFEPSQLLGWRDDRHVVVGHYRTTVDVVDVVTGKVDTIDMTGQGKIMNAPLLAADLWRNPLVAPAEVEGTSDPRRPFLWGGGALLILLAVTLLVRRRQRSA